MSDIPPLFIPDAGNTVMLRHGICSRDDVRAMISSTLYNESSQTRPPTQNATGEKARSSAVSKHVAKNEIKIVEKYVAGYN